MATPSTSNSPAPDDAEPDFQTGHSVESVSDPGARRPAAGFSLGGWGLPVNLVAVVWGTAMVVNVSWPRAEIYGESGWGRFAAPLSTAILVAAGGLYYGLIRRHQTGILPEHAATERDPEIRALEQVSANLTSDSDPIVPGASTGRPAEDTATAPAPLSHQFP
jgi:hypothetical protein